MTKNKKDILKAYDLAYEKWIKFNKLLTLDLIDIREIGLNSNCKRGAKDLQRIIINHTLTRASL